MAFYTLIIQASGSKVASDISSYVQRAQPSDVLQINCAKGGESLTKEVLTVLSNPQLRKKYLSADRDTKDIHCVVVRF